MRPETWVQVYWPPEPFESGPDGEPRKEFWSSEYMGTSWSRGPSDPLPRETHHRNVIQRWERAA